MEVMLAFLLGAVLPLAFVVLICWVANTLADRGDRK